MAKLSIIIPVFNEENTIQHILSKIELIQLPSFIQKEVIVVDDHSTDNTASIIISYADKNVKLISLKDFVNDKLNSYKKKAIEIAIAQSTGELIVTTDADCFAKKTWLQGNQVQCYEWMIAAAAIKYRWLHHKRLPLLLLSPHSSLGVGEPHSRFHVQLFLIFSPQPLQQSFQ